MYFDYSSINKILVYQLSLMKFRAAKKQQLTATERSHSALAESKPRVIYSYIRQVF